MNNRIKLMTPQITLQIICNYTQFDVIDMLPYSIWALDQSIDLILE